MTQDAALYIMKTGRNVFLTGAPGTGKTFVLNQYLTYLKEHGVEAAITAPTGIAASHIGGMTLHSFFGIGIKESLTQYDIENLTEKKYLWERIKELKILVIDEVSMLSPGLFESIDSILKTFKFSQEPFGGVQVILVGDFFQLPPISKKNVEKRFIFQSEIWKELDLATCYLERSYRHNDEKLLTILNEIRQGNVSEESMQLFRSRYKKKPHGKDSFTKLYTHNVDVDTINHRELDKISGMAKKFEAHTTGPAKWIEKIFGSSLVVPELSLKKGALVFFVKNNYERGYINGTLGTITEFDTFGVPIVETFDGKEIKAQREEWIFEDNDGKPKASIKQVPLRLAWAITIHKSQGMTLDAAEIDLSKAFEPGQGYVALSRITSLEGLCLVGMNDIALKIDSHVFGSDDVFKENSYDLYRHTENLSEKDKIHYTQHHMKYLGGSKELGSKKQDKNDSDLEKLNSPKIKSFLESKPFFEKEMKIIDIAKERDMTEPTIMKHLSQILDDDPEFDISYLQPDIHIINKVDTAVSKIKKTNNSEDFSESGEIKLKPIFIALGEKIDYDDIKLSLLFLE
jgi:hypothetical protein